MVGTILLLMGASKWPYAPKLATSRSTHENGTPSYKVILLGQYEVDTNNSGWDQKPMHCGVDPTNQNHMEIYFGPTITYGKTHMYLDFSFQVTYVLNRYPRGRGNDQRELGGDPGRI